MSKKGRRKSKRQRQDLTGPWGQYGFWIIGAILAITLVVIGIVASDGNEGRTTSFLPEIPRTNPEIVKAKMDSGIDITIVDARSITEYNRGHIVGAISIPWEETAQRYNELNSDSEIAIYCD